MSRTWLITGASRGLGRALAEAVLATGDNVLATAREPSVLDDLVAAHPQTARAFRLDVTDREQCSAAVAAAQEAFGSLDVVVNNAGYANIQSIEDFDEDDFRTQVETVLWGVINMSRAALPSLREQRSGHVIQISSAGGREAGAGLAPYVVGKWGIEGFSTSLSREVAHLGIRVTLIEPGGMRTDWAGSSMTVYEIRPDYEPSVGLTVKFRNTSVPPGDPVKVAKAIIQVADMDEPPLRVLLGTDAFAVVRAADEARMANDDRWTELTFSTDHDDAEVSLDALREMTRE
jgi:NAD(P)-dependent dehydrogenase (short-subunit alcohol dehydrogenase family)